MWILLQFWVRKLPSDGKAWEDMERLFELDSWKIRHEFEAPNLQTSLHQAYSLKLVQEPSMEPCQTHGQVKTKSECSKFEPHTPSGKVKLSYPHEETITSNKLMESRNWLQHCWWRVKLAKGREESMTIFSMPTVSWTFFEFLRKTVFSMFSSQVAMWLLENLSCRHEFGMDASLPDLIGDDFLGSITVKNWPWIFTEFPTNLDNVS